MDKTNLNYKIIGLSPKTFLFILGIICYSTVLFNNYNLDDNLVTQKHRLTSQGLKAIPEIFVSPYFNESVGSYEYRPIVLTSFAIEHQLFGERAHISHFVNLLLYAGCLVSLWLFLIALVPHHNGWVFIGCMLFALHPLHSEVVASIKNRDELLAFLFGITALGHWLKFWRTEGSWYSFWIGMLLLILALLSKRSFIPLVGAFLIFGSFFVQNQNFLRFWIVTLPCLFIITILSPAWLLYQQIIFATISMTLLLIPYFRVKTTRKKIVSAPSKVFWSLIRQLKTINSKFNLTLFYFVIANISLLCIAFYCMLQYEDLLLRTRLIILLLPLTYLIINKNELRTVIAISGLLATVLFEAHVLISIATAFAIYIHYRKQLIGAVYSIILIFLFLIVDFKKYNMEATDQIIPFILFLLFWYLLFKYHGHTRNHFYIKVLGALCIFLIATSAFENDYFFLDSLLGLLIFIIPIMNLKNQDRLFHRIQIVGTIGSIAVILFSILLFNIKNTGLSPSITQAISRIEIKINSTSRGTFIGNFIPNNFPSGYYTKMLTGQDLARNPKENTPQSSTLLNKSNLTSAPSITPVAETNRVLAFVENPLGDNPTFSKRIAYGMGSIGYYTRLLLFPFPLSAYYGYDTIPILTWGNGYTYLGFIVLLLLFGIITYSARRRLVAGWIFGWWGLLGLVAVSNLVFPIAGIIGERLIFGTSLSFCIGLGWVFSRILKLNTIEEFTKRLKSPTAGVWLFLGLLIIYQVVNFQRIRQWKDPITLFTADLEHFPRSSQGHQLLANRLKDAAEKSNNAEEQRRLYAKALNHYRTSADIWPEYRESQLQAGNLSILFQQPQEAIERYRKVLSLGPGSGQLYFNLGNAYEQLNQTDSAIKAYKVAIKLDPNNIAYFTNLSFLYFRLRQVDSSLQINRMALKQLPGTLEPLINLGKTFYQLQRWDSAIVYFEKAYPLGKQDPNLIQILAELHSKVGNSEKSQYYRKQLVPPSPQLNSRP